MPARISLALTLHNHQPVGNFGWVFAEVYDQAYRPMLDALERHPHVRLSLHYTGALLEWLRSERPEFVERLHELVVRGQVELLGGGLYEPVLASLPEHDRVAQLVRMADQVEAIAGRRPRGAWLAERVWEPDLPTSLVAAGYRWTILDDAHFRAAAIPEADLWGAYTTEDQGQLLSVFGTEYGLRYLIPFHDVGEVIEHLRANATETGERLGTMGDDGEKFGGWPTTFEHCWGRGQWVDRFFEALDANRSWLTTVTPSAWLDDHPPIGRVYVPTGSYIEMGVWALPADQSVEFKTILDRAREERRPEERWLRGAFWRNFQVKYREVNDLHKQMLRTSAKVASVPGGASPATVDHLHRGQSNDCYWHGLFGGVYINHMRLATFEHLIAAEDDADGVLGSRSAAELVDLDLDGIDEALLADEGQVVSVKLDEGAGIGSWDVRAARHALAAVMRRRPEAYHETLRARERTRAEAEAGARRAADAAAADAAAADAAAADAAAADGEGGARVA
ncbi:MAG: alpha-amylase/4-alpha-glucanotransferase domain-containing protein, partial [Chloroflexota bacterium]